MNFWTRLFGVTSSGGAGPTLTPSEAVPLTPAPMLAKQLLAAGADPKILLLQAAINGNIESAKALLAAKPDVLKNDAMRAAAREGHLNIVTLLLASGANVNAADRTGGTALMAASGAGHTEIVKALLAAGADANAQLVMDMAGMTSIGGRAGREKDDVITALSMASANNNSEVVKLLQEALRKNGNGGHSNSQRTC